MERLTPLDGSFLRVETENAHMHVAWSATFTVPEGSTAPSVEALRRSVAARLGLTPRFRRRLRPAPPGLGEPFWVDDDRFDVADHVVPLCDPEEVLDDSRFAALCDRALSEPLDRERPLWRFYLAPRLAGGRAGMVAKLHHALVDGKSAVEVATLLFDAEPAPAPRPEPEEWRPARTPGAARVTLGALAGAAGESLGAARGVARLAGSPRRESARVAGTLRRAALAVGEDLLRPAPPSYLNVRIGPRRALARHRMPIADVDAIRRRSGATLNDVCLAIVAGAMRELSLARRVGPAPLKAMVPVSVRADDDRAALGNRISMAFVELPADVSSARTRLALVQERTGAFKTSGRADGTGTVFSALGLLPDPLRSVAARAVGSARVYNLTVSNVPGPDAPLYMLGCELREAHPVVPIAEEHALSIGIFSYHGALHFGLYADPDALPEVAELPAALSAATLTLARAVKRGRPARTPSVAPAPAGVRSRGQGSARVVTPGPRGRSRGGGVERKPLFVAVMPASGTG
jgi:WS/DGAT/MGAT family acyltransferase